MTNGEFVKREDAAQSAHETVDKVTDEATDQLDRLSGAAHRAVDRAARAADAVADVQTRFTEAAYASIRARPIATVAGAFVIGYLFGCIVGRRTD